MAVINTNQTDSLNTFRLNTNTVSQRVGDTITLTTTASDLTGAINEHDLEIGDLSTLDVNILATSIVGALNEHQADIGVITSLSTTNKNNLVAALNELDSEIGPLGTLTTVVNSTIVGSINEVDANADAAQADATLALTNIGTLVSLTTTAKNTIVAAINELDLKQGSAALSTTATNISSAINELHTDIGTLALNASFTANNLTAAVNELDNEKVSLTDAGSQTLNTNLLLPGGKTFQVDGILDISGGTLNTGGGSLNLNTTFITLGDNAAATPSDGGIIIERGTSVVNNPQIFWDDSAHAWYAITATAVDTIVTAKIVDRENARELFENNTETGINVTWDDVNNNFDIAIAPNGVALGSQTTGSYIATITGTANEIEVSGSGTESAGVTIGLPANPIVSGITAGNLDVGVSQANTISTNTGGLILDSNNNVVTVNANATFNGTTTVVGDLNLSGATSDLSVGGNAVIAGNLTVQGTTTIVNTETVTIADNIIVVNSDFTGATPTENGGIEVERGTQANVSLIWNETTDRWSVIDLTGTRAIQRDGDRVLGITDGDGSAIAFTNNDTVTFSEGAGIDVNYTDITGPAYTLRFTNTDRGSVQQIFKTIAVSGQTSIVADSNNDTLTFAQGSGMLLTTNATTDTLTITNTDRGSQQNIFKTIAVAGQTAITADTNSDVLTVANGTGITVTTNATTDVLTITNSDRGSTQNIFKNVASDSGTAVADSNNDTLTLTGGLDIATSVSADTVTFAHTTYSAASANNANGVVIQDVTLSNGHVTGFGTVNLDNRYVNLSGNSTISGVVTISSNPTDDRILKLTGDAASNPTMTFVQGTTERGYIRYINGGRIDIHSTLDNRTLKIDSNLNWFDGTADRTVLHAGNHTTFTDSKYLRADTPNTAAGMITFTGGVNVNSSMIVNSSTIFTADAIFTGLAGLRLRGSGNQLYLGSSDTATFRFQSNTLDVKNTLNSGFIRFITPNQEGQEMVGVVIGSAIPEVKLYYSASERLKTVAGGIDVSGSLYLTKSVSPNADIAGSSQLWVNQSGSLLYTTDNPVWPDYTLALALSNLPVGHSLVGGNQVRTDGSGTGATNDYFILNISGLASNTTHILGSTAAAAFSDLTWSTIDVIPDEASGIILDVTLNGVCSNTGFASLTVSLTEVGITIDHNSGRAWRARMGLQGSAAGELNQYSTEVVVPINRDQPASFQFAYSIANLSSWSIRFAYRGYIV